MNAVGRVPFMFVDPLKEIPHPDRLSIEDIHRRVEILGHKCTFGRCEDSDRHCEQFGVDRAEEFGVIGSEGGSEAEQRSRRLRGFRWSYRDESSESSESSEARDGAPSPSLDPAGDAISLGDEDAASEWGSMESLVAGSDDAQHDGGGSSSLGAGSA
jgi:hypothetical protein